ncbi:MAG: TRAP transporter small permease [Lewinellaceae bacterium]|nr:TRAP transporter small permease [Saprospiraceae bacterium]MCB9339814.1 TRAP transporter small permease [Lewinellaceae bacterium]
MKKTIDKYLAYLLVFLMAIITLDVLWGVFTRYALGSQAGWTEELARYLLIWIGMLGAAYASGQKMHLAIDLLSPKLSPKAQARLSIFINILIAGFALTAMVFGGLRLMYITHTLGQTSAAMRVPIALVYSAIPVAGLLVVFYKINERMRE